jgi:drug/metabolite transporter (DMT)-like permease
MLKYFTAYVDAWTANGIRYPFAALLWLGPLLYQCRRGEVNPRIWKAALLPTAINVGAQALWALIPYYIDATWMAFLARISVPFAIAGGFLCFPDERALMRRPSFWMGVLMSAVGFVVLSLGGESLPEGRTLIGVILVFVCGAFYGLYGVAVRYSMRGSRPWVAFPVISLYTSAVLIVFMFCFGEPARLFDLNLFRFGFMLLSALVGIACAHTLFYIAIEHLGVAISSGTQLLGPCFTFLWAFLFLGEKLTLVQWGGGSVLLLGGALLLRGQTRLAPENLDAKKVPVEPRLPD